MNPDKQFIYYLASPYSTPVERGQDPVKLRNSRHEQVQYVGHKLYELGYVLVEPIASSHYKAEKYGSKATYEYWKSRDRKFIDITDGVIVLNIEGWKESVGVTDEIGYAKACGKPVYLLTYNRSNGEFSFEDISYTTYLSASASEQLAEMLENPPEPNEKLKSLFRSMPPIEGIFGDSVTISNETKKHDVRTSKIKYEKARLDLNPPEAEYAMAAAFEDGAKKYGEKDWESNDFNPTERIAAIKRHCNRLLMGETHAKDSGLHHAAHILANAAMIITRYTRKGDSNV